MNPAQPIVLRFSDGRSFAAADAWEAIAWLNSHSLLPEADPWRFMLRLAARQRGVDGRRIHSADPLRFLADLAQIGWFTLEGSDQGAASGDGSPGADGSSP